MYHIRLTETYTLIHTRGNVDVDSLANQHLALAPAHSNRL